MLAHRWLDLTNTQLLELRVCIESKARLDDFGAHYHIIDKSSHLLILMIRWDEMDGDGVLDKDQQTALFYAFKDDIKKEMIH